eukprot:GILJ01015373.1.p1 GENE.GILJ01015373.1~~GILJ01015373.1.p1  ORF type:complete len:276 (+),score=19.10 GILJ01015373.1:96-923(+)
MLSPALGLWGVLIFFVALPAEAATSFNVSYSYSVSYNNGGGCNLCFRPSMSPQPTNNASLFWDFCPLTYTVTSLDAGASSQTKQFYVSYSSGTSFCVPFSCATCRIETVSNCTVATPADKYKGSTISNPVPATYHTYSDRVVYLSVLIPVLIPFWLVFFFLLLRWSRRNKISLLSEVLSSGGAFFSTFETLWFGFWKFLATWFLCVEENRAVDNAPKSSMEMISMPASVPLPPQYQLQMQAPQAPQAMVVVLNGVPTLVYVMPNQPQFLPSQGRV